MNGAVWTPASSTFGRDKEYASTSLGDSLAVRTLSSAVDLFLIKPLFMLFMYGSSVMGHGGKTVYEVCAKNTGYPVEFWTANPHNMEWCESQVEKDFASYAVTLLIPLYAFILYKVARGALVVLCRILRMITPGPMIKVFTDTPPFVSSLLTPRSIQRLTDLSAFAEYRDVRPPSSKRKTAKRKVETREEI